MGWEGGRPFGLEAEPPSRTQHPSRATLLLHGAPPQPPDRPARLKSTSVWLLPARLSAPPCTLFPASSSRWARVMPKRRGPSGVSTVRCPPLRGFGGWARFAGCLGGGAASGRGPLGGGGGGGRERSRNPGVPPRTIRQCGGARRRQARRRPRLGPAPLPPPAPRSPRQSAAVRPRTCRSAGRTG